MSKPTIDQIYDGAAITPRPVFRRVLMRKNGEPLDPPTDAEKHDAIMLLGEGYSDDVGDEAFRILDEYGR